MLRAIGCAGFVLACLMIIVLCVVEPGAAERARRRRLRAELLKAPQLLLSADVEDLLLAPVDLELARASAPRTPAAT